MPKSLPKNAELGLSQLKGIESSFARHFSRLHKDAKPKLIYRTLSCGDCRHEPPRVDTLGVETMYELSLRDILTLQKVDRHPHRILSQPTDDALVKRLKGIARDLEDAILSVGLENPSLCGERKSNLSMPLANPTYVFFHRFDAETVTGFEFSKVLSSFFGHVDSLEALEKALWETAKLVWNDELARHLFAENDFRTPPSSWRR